MYSKKYVAQLEKYAKKTMPNFDRHETLSANDHRLIVENSASIQLQKIYNNLNNLTEADLIDFFAMERRNGRN